MLQYTYLNNASLVIVLQLDISNYVHYVHMELICNIIV